MLAEAANNNIKVIFPFVNFWPDLGGMQWYVDQARPSQGLTVKPLRYSKQPRLLCTPAVQLPPARAGA